MKQIIERNYKGVIRYKYYENDRGQVHGLYIRYQNNGKVWHKTSYVNDEECGIQTEYSKHSIILKYKYYL